MWIGEYSVEDTSLVSGDDIAQRARGDVMPEYSRQEMSCPHVLVGASNVMCAHVTHVGMSHMS
jgi:hypothetical protein